MNALEHDVLEVLSLVQSVKNSFAPINRIPPEVLSFIPDYRGNDKNGTDQDLIALTHVCRSWRDTIISRSSLWTRLDFKNAEKTHTYIQRSKLSPLEVYLKTDGDNAYLDSALFLVTPHTCRIRSLTIYTKDQSNAAPVLNCALLDRDLSSLRRLGLSGVITDLPWKNLANLTTLSLKSCRPGRDFVTRLLDFFENTPLLRTIMLEDSIPKSSNAPSGRIVPLPRLNILAITAKPAHSVLLKHLHIPAGASLVLKFSFSGERSPLRDYLPETYTNLRNLSRITSINLHFGAIQRFVRMNGSSGGLCILGHWDNVMVSPYDMDRRILLSLGSPVLLATRRLAVSKYEHPRPAEVEKCPVFRTLFSMDSLRTLVLNKCHNLPFILALNPEGNSSKLLLCPNLEKLVLYVESRDQFHIDHLISMAKKRTLKDRKLSSVTIVGLGELVLGKEVFRLREHITCVEYRVDDAQPDWDDPPDESGDESE